MQGRYDSRIRIGLRLDKMRRILHIDTVSAGFIAILGIGAWIGYTMATTPPPKPIEEITAETQTETKATPT